MQGATGLGNVGRLLSWRIEPKRDNVARLVLLSPSGLHLLRKAPLHLPHEIPGQRNHTLAGAKVLFKLDGLYPRVSLGEVKDVLHVTAAPLIKRLVVIAYDTHSRAEFVERAYNRLLHGIHVLVFVHDDVAHPLLEANPKPLVVGEGRCRLLEDARVIEVALLVKQRLVVRQVCRDRARLQPFRVRDHVFSQDGMCRHVVRGVDEALQNSAGRGRAEGQTGFAGIAVHEQALLDLVQHLIFQELGHLRLQHLKAEAVDGPHVHLSKPNHVAEGIATALINALLELRSSLFGEREGDDVLRPAASTS